ncbi:MAG: NUDIX hydrolase [Candidatus Nucleicultricaceae bacterium]
MTQHRNPVQVVVFPFRIKEGKAEYLLLHRNPHKDSFWQGVSGGARAGEALDLAAARELKEETAFEAIVQSINHQFEYPVKEKFRHIYAPNVKVIKEHSFIADVTGLDDPILSDEHDAFKWLQFDEIDIDCIQWEGSKAAIKIANTRIMAYLKLKENG